MLASPILVLVAVFMLIGARQVKHHGRLDWIVGVQDSGVLRTPQGLGAWVGNVLLVLAAILLLAAGFAILVPERYLPAVFVPLVIGIVVTMVIGAMGVQSRSRTK